MTSETKNGRTGKGEATNRLLHALAAEFPQMHTDDSFLESESLRIAHGKSPHEELTVNEKIAARKAINRLVREKAIKASLWLNGKDDRVRLTGSGLVAISVDIATLREEEWLRSPGAKAQRELRQGLMLASDRPATQEAIMETIIERTKEWSEKNDLEKRLPLILTNIAIVHGAVDFDILVNVSFVDQNHLLQYAREVIQRIPHVRATQTMLLSSVQGFSNP